MSTPEDHPGGPAWLRRAMAWFEQGLIIALVVMLAIIIALATLELGWQLIQHIRASGVLAFPVAGLLDLFGLFLLILIGVELLETIKAYLKTHVVHVEIVLEVALIALARKVIVLDFEKYSSLTVFGIAALLLAVAIAFSLERHVRRKWDDSAD